MVWMLYGATGYTGKLLLEEAIRRGHRPLIAGRSAAKLKPLADAYGVDFVTFGLDQAERLQALGVDLVLNAAGPFIHTAQPIMDACLQAGCHYLDITGEVPVFEALFTRDQAARDRKVLLMSGVGFDIVPSDCLAKYVADKLPTANRLDVVIVALGSAGAEIGASAGTLKSAVENLPKGGRVRRNGILAPYDFGSDVRTFRFADGEHQAMAIPWGDVVAAYYSTGIPNITAYMSFPPRQIAMIRTLGFVLMTVTRLPAVRQWLSQQIERLVPGPSPEYRRTARAQVYAQASDGQGGTAEAWLDTLEGYAFTAKSGILAVERVLDGNFSGVLTPSQAFGADFVLEIESTRRDDAL